MCLIALASQSTNIILTNNLLERSLQKQNHSKVEVTAVMNVNVILIHSFISCHLLWTYVKTV